VAPTFAQEDRQSTIRETKEESMQLRTRSKRTRLVAHLAAAATVAAVAAIHVPAASADHNAPGGYWDGEAWCNPNRYNLPAVGALITVNGPAMWPAYDGALGSTLVIHPTQLMGYRAWIWLQDRNGRWIVPPRGTVRVASANGAAWLYRQYGETYTDEASVASATLYPSTFFEVLRPGRYAVTIQMWWYANDNWPHQGYVYRWAKGDRTCYYGY
jgi:hypothetical protein